MRHKSWICEICAQEFDYEVDLLAHQFNSSCEREMHNRLNKTDNQPLDSDGESDAVYCAGCGFTHSPGKCPDGLNGRR